MAEQLLAYTNTKMTKAQVLKRVRAHRKADEICFGGVNAEAGECCAVTCTLDTYDHSLYPKIIDCVKCPIGCVIYVAAKDIGEAARKVNDFHRVLSIKPLGPMLNRK